ncbi:MAG: hypothetical protein SH817_02300 [Leptospira sp.]|nr:hypothetical protein [Leptospira sp.]
MKVFSLLLSISLFFLGSCGKKIQPITDEELALISKIFIENQKVHEDLLGDPPKISTLLLKQSIDELLKSKNDRILEWHKKLSVALPKETKVLDDSFEGLSKFAIVLTEIKKEVNLPENYQQFYCPMVDKYWVSKDQTIRNPYAPEMRDCGEIITEQ